MFNVLMELFNRVGLQKNVENTVSMACQPYRAIGGNSTESYRLRMAVEGVTHRERLSQRVRRPEQNTNLEAG